MKKGKSVKLLSHRDFKINYGTVDNKNLKSIPDCISTLPNLTFVNTNRCPNVKVPEFLEPFGTGDGFYYLSE
jgi:Leucine-rich repeat (LRR) protein